MTVKKVAQTLPDTYFILVQQFPLIHLRDEDHLDAAQAVIDQYFGVSPNAFLRV